ncbi:MAG: right-handed parallel beta-helix repeat-containing protein [Planctomycetota bacterium]
MGGSAGAQVLYVDDDAPLIGDGSSWATAYRYLQDALADAEASGGAITEIRIAQGTYRPDQDEGGLVTPDDRDATFQLLNGVELLGGHAGIGAPNPDERLVDTYVTVLSGDLLGDDLPDYENIGENSYSVVMGSGTDVTAVIDGFTIKAGHANGEGDDPLHLRRGAGMWNLMGSPTVSNCRFENNVADGFGAGMYNHTTSNSLVDGCTFVGNWSVAGGGGGMYNGASDPVVSNCTFEGNMAPAANGGAMCNQLAAPTITGSTFEANTALGGGAISHHPGSPSFIEDCQFIGNWSSNGIAGAIFFIGSDATVMNCVFTDNDSGAFSGGAIFNEASSPDVIGCTFTGNTTGVNGGAIRNQNGSSPFIQSCTFTGNGAGSVGAAIANHAGNPTITGCTFESNVAAEFGGGVFNLVSNGEITNCEFTGNLAATGAAVYNWTDSSPEITNTTFINNFASGWGGAMYNYNGSSPTITDCAFINNEASTGAGGAIGGIDTCSPTIVRCHFEANTAFIKGGAIMLSFYCDAVIVNSRFIANTASNGGAIHAFEDSNPVILNSTLAGNQADLDDDDDCGDGEGGAVAAINGSRPLIVNSTIVDNSAVGQGGGVCSFGEGSDTVIVNSIVYGNVAASNAQIVDLPPDCDGSEPLSVTTVSYSNVQGGWAGAGANNIDADPLFADADGPDDDPLTYGDNDYGLTSGSPCVDAGHNWAVPADTEDLDGDSDVTELTPLDFDGNPRFSDDAATADTGCGVPVVVDMGAYELPGSAADVVLGDFNGDGAVGTADLLTLLSAWGPCGPDCCLEDLDLNGTVGTSDLLILLSNWG